VTLLSDVAPFVVSAVGSVPDACCLEFVTACYEKLFSGYSIKNSFDHAQNLLDSKLLNRDSFRLDRRAIVQKGDAYLIETLPDPKRESIWVDLSAVTDTLPSLGMPEEEVLHLIAKN